MGDTFYFIAYLWRGKSSNQWTPGNQLIKNIHPVAWIVETTERHDEALYALTFWAEIDEATYKAYEDAIE